MVDEVILLKHEAVYATSVLAYVDKCRSPVITPSPSSTRLESLARNEVIPVITTQPLELTLEVNICDLLTKHPRPEMWRRGTRMMQCNIVLTELATDAM